MNSPATPNGCNCAEPLILTMEEWKKKHRDFKGITNGQRYALRLCPVHGTTSQPVVIQKVKKA